MNSSFQTALPLSEVIRKVGLGTVEIFSPDVSCSGFVIDTSGHILTNAAAVDGAQDVDVIFHDGSFAKGWVKQKGVN